MNLSSSVDKDDRSTPTMSSSELLGKRVKRMSLEVPYDLHTELKRVAIDHNMFMRDAAVQAIREWLDRAKKDPNHPDR